MKKINYFLFGTLLFLASSCSDDKNNNKEFTATYKCDIDGKGDWINCQTIGKFGGVTGDYCSKLDSAHEYGLGLSKTFSEISPDPVEKIKISVWVKLSDLNKKSILVVSVDGQDKKNIFWSGHDLNPFVKEANKWTKFESEDILTDIKTTDAIVGIYIWNPNKDIVYIDDYDIQFLPK